MSACTLEEVVRSQADNRAWGKELRFRTYILVNNRLAKLITQDEYQANRARAHEDAAEYRRRASILTSEIARRA